jgi:hypothetical protein
MSKKGGFAGIQLLGLSALAPVRPVVLGIPRHFVVSRLAGTRGAFQP